MFAVNVEAHGCGPHCRKISATLHYHCGCDQCHGGDDVSVGR